MLALYFQLFWLPTVIAAGLLLLSWVNGRLPDRASLFVGWFLSAFLLQFVAPFTGSWGLGLLLQTALALVLVMRRQLA